ncbi:MAG: serine hydrolase [Kiloniellales bacterium]
MVIVGAAACPLPSWNGSVSADAREARQADIEGLSPAETERLGWDADKLDAAFDFAAQLSSDTLVVVTDGKVVRSLGDLERRYPLHSIRKVLLSSLIGQHLGDGPKRIDLETTLEELGIDDDPGPLTPLQKQATVQHLMNGVSGINHAAAAEAGLTAEKTRRLGLTENEPGTKWAYNNWDHNALTTIFEARTGLSVAEAFEEGFATPLLLQDFSPEDVSYIEEPEISLHRAVSFSMSARDLARFGMMFLGDGEIDGRRMLPAFWVDRIASDPVATGNDGLWAGYSHLWWVPASDTGLPEGSFWALGLGHQALMVIPAWQTVIVHQADMSKFFQRFIDKVQSEGIAPEKALEALAIACLMPLERESEFCREHRFILRKEFSRLIALIADARVAGAPGDAN